MKIAVPVTSDNYVDSHFGHCEYFNIYTVNNETKEIINSETIESPQGCGCKSNISAILKQMGVEVMLAGNMGAGAVNVLNAHNISVYRGCEGSADKLVNDYIIGKILDSGDLCAHHENGHTCGH